VQCTAARHVAQQRHTISIDNPYWTFVISRRHEGLPKDSNSATLATIGCCLRLSRRFLSTCTAVCFLTSNTLPHHDINITNMTAAVFITGINRQKVPTTASTIWITAAARASFSALTLLFGSSGLYKSVSKMIYNVSSGTLSRQFIQTIQYSKAEWSLVTDRLTDAGIKFNQILI